MSFLLSILRTEHQGWHIRNAFRKLCEEGRDHIYGISMPSSLSISPPPWLKPLSPLSGRLQCLQEPPHPSPHHGVPTMPATSHGHCHDPLEMCWASLVPTPLSLLHRPTSTSVALNVTAPLATLLPFHPSVGNWSLSPLCGDFSYPPSSHPKAVISPLYCHIVSFTLGFSLWLPSFHDCSFR